MRYNARGFQAQARRIAENRPSHDSAAARALRAENMRRAAAAA